MHEFSLATSILELARQHVPAGATLRIVRVEAGPKRAIDPDAMQFVWQALVHEKRAGDVKLQLTILPWRLKCPQCNREWTSDELYVPCACGTDESMPLGGDELRLVSLDVDEG